MRKIKFSEAIREALKQSMENNDSIYVMGIGVDDSIGIFGTTLNLHKEFGEKRVFDIPITENAITGIAIGSALVGMRPIMVHARNDFMLYSMDQIVNHAAKWRYMSGGKFSVPLTIRSIIGRGWGQGAQHSQSLHALFMHIPGLKVVMPSTPFDAKGLLISSIEDDSPTIFIEHRWLYDHVGNVPEKPYSIPLGQGNKIREGDDITVVAISYMVYEANRAAESLHKDGIEIEIIDLRSLKPLDEKIIYDSVKKTGRLIVLDVGSITCGAGAEISALVASNAFEYLKAPIRRISLPDIPAPTSHALEGLFYPGPSQIISTVRELVLGKTESPKIEGERYSVEDFKGPF